MKINKRFTYTIIAIIFGVLIGSLILLINNINPIKAYKVIFLGAFGKPKYVSWVIVRSVPYILTGLSVAFAFQTGLFNIGAEGQFIVGSIGALVSGLLLNLPPVIHAIVALIVGTLCGSLWGAIVGYLKSNHNVNEVISSIMLNWIGFYLLNYSLTFPSLRSIESDNSYTIKASASIRFLGEWKKSQAGRAFLSHNKILRDVLNPPVNWGIILAIVCAIVIWYILKKTTLGYELKSVGFNADAAEYAGINIKSSIIKSMAISGALAGLAGAIMVLGVNHHIGKLASMENYGFDGMAVALIAGNAPLGVIPAALLFSGLNYGGAKLTTIGTYSEVVKIVIGIIIIFISMPKLFDIIKQKFKNNSKVMNKPQKEVEKNEWFFT